MTQKPSPVRPVTILPIPPTSPVLSSSTLPVWQAVTTFSMHRRHLPSRTVHTYTLCHAAACRDGDLVRTGRATQDAINALAPCQTCLHLLAQGELPCQHTEAHVGHVEAGDHARGTYRSALTCLRCVDISREYVTAAAGAPASGFLPFQRFIA